MAPRDTWTEERIDDLRAETKREFTAVRTEMRAGFDRVDEKLKAVDERFDRVDKRFDKLNRTLLWFCGSLLVAVIASLFTLVASLLIS